MNIQVEFLPLMKGVVEKVKETHETEMKIFDFKFFITLV